MCFGGGGGQQQQAPAPINFMAQAPIVKTPEPPKQLTQEYKPLQSQAYQPGIQQAGASRRRQDLAANRQSLARRRGLSIGISGSQAAPPSGGINL
jgi:hypothetical protein